MGNCVKILGRRFFNPTSTCLFIANYTSSAAIKKLIKILPENTILIVPQALQLDFDNSISLDDWPHIQKAIESDQHVCILTTADPYPSNQLYPFHENVKKSIEHSKHYLVPIYSYQRRRIFTTQFIFTALTQLPPQTPAYLVKQVLHENSKAAVEEAVGDNQFLHTQFIKAVKRHPFKQFMRDSLGSSAHGFSLILRAVTLSEWLKRKLDDRDTVAVLLPNTVAGAVVNIALMLLGKVPVNLNYTIGQAAVDKTITASGAVQVITSKAFLERVNLKINIENIYLEEVKGSLIARDKIKGLLAVVTPAYFLLRKYKPHGSNLAPATILFSSGTTGEPKGIILTHRNLLCNLLSIQGAIDLSPQEKLMGILPFFHSFGFTVTLWLPLTMGLYVFYHPNPLDIKGIPDYIENQNITCFVTTPTFCRHYLDRTEKEKFQSLRRVITGAEKLNQDLAKSFKSKFGITISEGYGCTELGPAVAANLTGGQEGSVGFVMPGMAAKIIDVTTYRDLSFNEEGLLVVNSSAAMTGYLGQAQQTAAAFHQGWYITGDIARMDEDGFIYIVDRQARFSKIGGEMVPHVSLEKAVQKIVGEGNAVVVSIPDAKKGEALVVLYTDDFLTPHMIYEKLKQMDLPNLWLPNPNAIFVVDAIPVTGTGKVDLKTAKQLALAKTQ